MRRLDVYRKGRLAGLLTETDDGQYVFRYDDTYYSDPSMPAVSLTLSKNKQEYSSSELFPFFINMLSEGSNRKTQSRLLKIDEDDHFGLLSAVAGSDTIGAVTLKPNLPHE